MSLCEVISCKSRNDRGRIYHKFPNDPSRRKDWLKALGCKKIVLKSMSTVCSKHFRIKDYYPGQKRLLPDAVPSLRLNNIITTNIKPNKNILFAKSSKNRSKQNTLNKPDATLRKVKKSNPSKRVQINTKPMSLGLKSIKVEKISNSQPLPVKINDKKDLKLPQKSVTNKTKKPLTKTIGKNYNNLIDSLPLEPTLRLQKINQDNLEVPSKKPEETRTPLELPKENNTQLLLKSKIQHSDPLSIGSRVCRGNTKMDSESKRKSIPTAKLKSNKELYLKTPKLNTTKKVNSPIQQNSKNLKSTNKAKEIANEVNNMDGMLSSTSKNSSPKLSFVNSKMKPEVELNKSINSNRLQKRKFEENISSDIKVKQRKIENKIILSTLENSDKDKQARINSSDNLQLRSDYSNSLELPKKIEETNSVTQVKRKQITKKAILSKSKDQDTFVHKKTCNENRNKARHCNISNLLKSSRAEELGVSKTKSKRRSLLSNFERSDNSVVKKIISEKGNGVKQPNTSNIQKQVTKNGQNNSKVNSNITNIEQTILEMQNKIQRLEKKSILDEKKIETFKKALLQQRNNDLKILMDEKENELLLRMDLLYLDYDPQRICLLCLLLVDKKESLTSLIWPPKNQSLIAFIKNATSVQIDLEDGMPTGICSDCLKQVKQVDYIKRRSQRSNMLIKKFITMRKALSEDNNSGTSLVYNGSEKPEFSDDFFQEEVTDVFKIEDVFSLNNSPEIMPFCNFPLKRESDEEVNVSSNRELPIITTKALFRKTWKCKGCDTIFTNPWSRINHFKYCTKRFQCSECRKCFWNNQLLHKHKQRLLNCICAESQRCCYDCEIVFRWKWQLVFHVLQHSRPQHCELCNEVFHSIEHLKLHVMNSHLAN